ncbi:MAG: Hfq-related RNA-binding protein [Pseudanabaenaceae cyanobacterium]
MSEAPVTSPSAKELDITLPSIRRLHATIRNKEVVTVKLATGDTLRGTLKWIDTECLCLDDGSPNGTLVWHHALAFVQFGR